MTELTFEVVGARPDRTALTPVLQVPLHIAVPSGDPVQSILLRCQIRVEPDRRAYDDHEEAGLHDLFGARERWSDTLQAFLLTHVTLPVRGFTGSTRVDLPVELSYDLEVTSGKYLHALRGGEVPLLFLFSGTIFHRTASGTQVQQIPWDREARYRLPVAVWQELMDLHFPGTGWVRLQRETIDGLQRVKTRHALPTWDDTVAHLLREEVRR